MSNPARASGSQDRGEGSLHKGAGATRPPPQLCAKSRLASYFPASWGWLVPWASSLFPHQGLGPGPLLSPCLASFSPLASLPPCLISSSCPPLAAPSSASVFFSSRCWFFQREGKEKSLSVLPFPEGKGLGSPARTWTCAGVRTCVHVCKHVSDLLRYIRVCLTTSPQARLGVCECLGPYVNVCVPVCECELWRVGVCMCVGTLVVYS